MNRIHSGVINLTHFKIKIIVILLACITVSYSNTISNNTEFKTHPTLVKSSKNLFRKWNIVIAQGGDYPTFNYSLVHLMDGLNKLGWTEKSNEYDYPQGDINGQNVWNDIRQKTQSDYINLNNQIFYNGEWNTKKTETVIQNIKKAKPDLIIALGTKIALELKKLKIPLMVLESTNPVDSGIVADNILSNTTDVWARQQGDIFLKQYKLFHNLFEFKTIGVVTYNSKRDHVITGYNILLDFAKNNDIEIQECVLTPSTPINDRLINLENCLKDMKNVDVIYISPSRVLNSVTMPIVISFAIANQIPTMITKREQYVKDGILLSYHLNYKNLGHKNAIVVSNFFNGAKLHNISQIGLLDYELSINISTAKKIGFDVPRYIFETANNKYK